MNYLCSENKDADHLGIPVSITCMSFLLLLFAWEGLHYFIVALLIPGPSITIMKNVL